MMITTVIQNLSTTSCLLPRAYSDTEVGYTSAPPCSPISLLSKKRKTYEDVPIRNKRQRRTGKASSYSLDEEVVYEEQREGQKVKGWFDSYVGFISKVHDDGTYDVVIDGREEVVQFVDAKFLKRKSEDDLMSMSKMATSIKGSIAYYAKCYSHHIAKEEEDVDPCPGLYGEALVVSLKEKLKNAQNDLKTTKQDNARLKQDLNGNSEDFESYTSRDDKLKANEFFCLAIKEYNLRTSGTTTGSNLPIAYLAAAAMNTTTSLLNSGVIGDSIVSMINSDERKCELIARFAKGLDIDYSIFKMMASQYIGLHIPVKALWLDYENTFPKNESDIESVFKNGLFRQGGVLGLTLSIRNDGGAYLEVNKKMSEIASLHGYQLSIFRNGQFYETNDDCSTWKYKLMKLYIYEVKKL